MGSSGGPGNAGADVGVVVQRVRPGEVRQQREAVAVALVHLEGERVVVGVDVGGDAQDAVVVGVDARRRCTTLTGTVVGPEQRRGLAAVRQHRVLDARADAGVLLTLKLTIGELARLTFTSLALSSSRPNEPM